MFVPPCFPCLLDDPFDRLQESSEAASCLPLLLRSRLLSNLPCFAFSFCSWCLKKSTRLSTAEESAIQHEILAGRTHRSAGTLPCTWPNMGFSSGHTLLALLVPLLASGLVVAAMQYDNSFNHYQSESNKYQPDTIAHTIVEIRTDMQFHECSNYCTLRGPDFG